VTQVIQYSDVINIKMTYRDLPYCENIRPKHTMNINFTKTSTIIMQTDYIPLEKSQVVVSSSLNSPFNGEYSHIQLT